MKIESVKLRGFTGIRKGLGVDEISLDLSGLSGLVALAGPNGMGKSTLLENLVPFRTLASRKGSLQHHVFLRDSQRDLSFRWHGDLYETSVKVDSQSGRGEAFIYKNGVPEIRGKSSEYDRYMRDLLGSEELFFASVFCAQNSAKLSDMTTGQLKELFSEFLRLDRYERWEGTAKDVIRTLAALQTVEDRQLDHLEKILAGQDETTGSLTAARKELEEIASSLSELRNALSSEDAAYLVAVRKAEANKGIRQKVADLEAQKGSTIKERKDAETKMQRALEELKTKVSITLSGIDTLSKILADREKILAAVEEEKAITVNVEKAIEEGIKSRDEIDALTASLHEKEQALTTLRAELKSLAQDPEIRVLDGKLQSLRVQVKTLDLKDPACQSTTCSFILQALEAQKNIPILEATIDKKTASQFFAINGLKEGAGRLEKEVDASRLIIITKTGHLNTHRTAVALTRAHLLMVSYLAKQAPEIQIAESKIGGLRVRQDELMEESIRVRSEWEIRDRARIESIKTLGALLEETRKQVDPEADKRLLTLESNIRIMKQQVEEAHTKQQTTQGRILSLEAKLKEMNRAQEALFKTRANRDHLISEAAQWAYLRDACGKNGLQALEIDSVAPTISAYANDLLQGTFGPLFSVRFRTQNDEGKEVLDILAIREDGTEALIENLSGGERVWILKALRLAMTLVSKEKSGRALGTCFADEEDGALDPENGQNFIQLYRSFLKSGGFESMYFISHKPECVSMADHVLMFNGKGIAINDPS